GLGGANEGDDFVDVVQRDAEAFQNMGALFGLAQIVAGAPDDDFFLVLQVMHQRVLQRQDAGLAVHQRQHDDAERRLQLRMPVQPVQNNARVGVPAQLDDDAHAVAVRRVPQVADAVYHFVPVQLGDFRNQVRLVDLERQLGDDDALASVGQLLDAGLAAHFDAPAPGLVGFFDAVAAQDLRAGRKVGAADDGHQLLDGRVGVVDEHDEPVDYFAQIVRRDVRGHADRDARRAVDEQVRDAGWQHDRLLQRVVEVGHEVDGLFVDVPQHLHRDAGQARLGVAHGRRRVAVHAAEVAVGIHQRVPVRKVLRHAHHGVVDGRVAVGVVLTHDVADDAGRLAVRPVRADAQLVHGVQNAPRHAFEPVAHVRQRPVDDDAHRVVEIRALHFVGHVNRNDATFRELDGHRCDPLNVEILHFFRVR